MLRSGAGAGTLLPSLLALTLSPLLVAAHGAHKPSDETMNMDMGMGMDMSKDVKPAEPVEYLPTYFAHTEHTGLLYAHIFIMIAAWVFVLPTGK